MSETKKHSKKFLKTFFQDRKQVGAVAPSWRFLVNKMCNQIDFENAKCIVEYGPGTGVFTTELLKRANKDCKLIVFELNDRFYNLLKEKIKDDRMILIKGSAEDVGQALEKEGIDKADAILSSLPLAVIPEVIREKILKNSSAHLKEGGLYLQYQYSLNAKKLIEENFKKLKISFVPINMPPAFVYKAWK